MIPLEPYGPVPSKRQLAWYRRGKTAFLHFSMNTFTGKEWGDGREDPELFAPESLDCRQWARVLREAGFTAAILTVKHHDGFCLWPSRFTEHSVRHSPGAPDVVRLFTDACREYGIQPGVYISPWDRNHPSWGTEGYNDIFAGQLTELMTGYGPLCECWWDGAGSTEARYDWGRWASIVRKNQPSCVIFGALGAAPYVDVRWIGNEEGRAADSCYGTIDLVSLEKETVSQLNTGKPDGERFIPAETNMSIRPGWFYHPDQSPKTVEALTDYWFRSAGRNTSILLNIPPDRRGKLPEEDSRIIKEWNRVMEGIFARNLVREGTLTVSSAPDEDRGPENLADSREDRIYLAGEYCPRITVFFPEKRRFDCFRLEEAIELGHRVRRFRLEIRTETGWSTWYQGGCIGFCQSRRLPAVETDGLRLQVEEAPAFPALRFLGLYDTDGVGQAREEAPAVGRVPIREVSWEAEGVVLNLGGIRPYNAVTVPESQSRLRVLAFNGARYETVFDGETSGSVRFPTVTGSYQLKVLGKMKVPPEVFLLPEKSE